MKTYTIDSIKIIHMNKASITAYIDGEHVFISRKVFNLLLRDSVEGKIMDTISPTGVSYKWLAVLSIF